jgi:hypothetical protein
VFAGGFRLDAACAVGGCGDDLATLDVLDALVRKSLLVADRSSGRTRFSMLETIRQFAEEQLVASGSAEEARTAHARYFAECETDVLTMWDSPQQREAYIWFTFELANLRTAFRCAADHHDLDVAAPIVTYAAFLGFWVGQYEPIAWAEELIQPARDSNHPRLGSLYVMASLCWMAGRIDDGVRYGDAAQTVLASSSHEPPYGVAGWLGAPYLAIGRPEQWAELCRSELARRHDLHVQIWACLVYALTFAGSGAEAAVAANGLIEAAEASANPCMLSFALCAFSFAVRRADPVRALDACRRGLGIAQDSGNRFNESSLALSMASLEADHGDTRSALDHVTLAIRNYYDSGNTSSMRSPLAILVALLDRLGRCEPAATIAGFALSPLSAAAAPVITTAIIHLRAVLGDQTYESLARNGETMTTAAMATYAYDQIDQSRAELNAVSK